MTDSMGMAVNLVRSTRLFPGAPYAYAGRASQGDLVFTAGACPLDEQGRVVAPGDVRAQVRQALRNLLIALEDSGAAIVDELRRIPAIVATLATDGWDRIGFNG